MKLIYFYKLVLTLLILGICLTASACDTLCVVYNIKNNKFEIDTASRYKFKKYPCYCNQKELGRYSKYLNKITIPPIIAYNNIAGTTYFAIRGTDIKIIRGICDEFNYEITNCYTKNAFCFDSVIVSLMIPYPEYRRKNNSLMTYKDLIHDFGIPETDKKMEVIVSDSFYFRRLCEFNKKLNLFDLTKTNDSLFIRVNYWSYPENEIYEIRYNQQGLQARMISYQITEFRTYFGFIFLNKHYGFCGKKWRDATWLYQCKISPTDLIDRNVNPDTLWCILNELNLLYLKTKNISNTMDYSTVDGRTDYFDIEIATSNLYRYIYWGDSYFFNQPSDTPIQKLYKMLFSGFDSDKNKKHKYKKDKWP